MRIRTLFLCFIGLAGISSIESVCWAQQKSEERRIVEKREVVGVPMGTLQPMPGFSINYGIESRLYDSNAPVRIIDSKPRIEEGPGLSAVEIENVSGKEVKAVKFKWHLFNDPTAKEHIKSGETREIKVSGFAAGEKKVVKTRLPEFDQLFQGADKDGKLEGQFSVEVSIAEVVYADGTKWRR